MRPPPAELGTSVSRTVLPAIRTAPSQARAFVAEAIAQRVLSSPPAEDTSQAPGAAGDPVTRLTDDAALLVSELVTNAFMHAGTEITVICTPEPVEGALTGVLVEVVDRQPIAQVPGEVAVPRAGRGLGLRVVSVLAESWGVTFRNTEKAVWFRVTLTEGEPGSGRPRAALGAAGFRLPAGLGGPAPSGPAARGRPGGWADGGGAFLAEASELLSGQLDEDMVAALAGQLLVPRLADWCAVWLTAETGGMRLSRVWHSDERRIGPLRRALAPEQPTPSLHTAGAPWPWPEGAAEPGTTGGSALAFALVSAGACQGTLVIGRSGPREIIGAVARTVEDTARLVAQAVVTARAYTRQTSISRALQRRQLPPALASIPGVESAVVYEPHARGQTVGGDFYDLFPMGGGRWCFLLGDVQGKDAEAMSVTGLTRHLVRLLAREGEGVASVLGRLNAAMAEEGAEAVAAGGEAVQPRFLSLVYGEVEPRPRGGGAHCALASAGHPPPLYLTADGNVRPASGPQLLLGIDAEAQFTTDFLDLAPGETLLCVTDGVTERRDGDRQLDDDDGLAGILRSCVGMGAMAVAERIRQAAHDFGPDPVEDDLAVLALHAVPT